MAKGGYHFSTKKDMASPIDKHSLEHLAKLARIELAPKEEEKLLKDLREILGYIEELKEVDVSAVAPMTGGTDMKNVFREDDGPNSTNQGAGIDAFPESKDGFLKIPPVFE
jgi:aspartyl-tRNA(Asn)/glutamyl-tRNA(Gln) amidotransferase subunit C